MPFKNCFGIITSVSILAAIIGAALARIKVNLSIITPLLQIYAHQLNVQLLPQQLPLQDSLNEFLNPPLDDLQSYGLYLMHSDHLVITHLHSLLSTLNNLIGATQTQHQ